MTNENNAYYEILGQKPLNGEIKVAGAKNAATKQMVASLLSPEPVILHNVPDIGDVKVTEELIKGVGTKVERIGPNSLRLETPEIKTTEILQTYSGINRIPILLLGPLLAREKEAKVPAMGGCRIGKRPVNFHTMGLRQMGAIIDENEKGFFATTRGLKGTHIELPFPSVGATENMILSGCMAEGMTVIKNAAVEPEVIDLVMMLQKMGANISVDVDRTIMIEGEKRLHGAEHYVIPDRIEAASFAVAAIMTGGQIEVIDARQEHMTSFFNLLKRVGAPFEIKTDRVIFGGSFDKLNPVALETDVHPGFMTDWQQPFVMMLTQAEGISVVHETVYERRFGYTEALKQMGAQIQLFNECLGGKPCRFAGRGHPHSAVISGPVSLKAADIEIPDLRAGFSYLVAALAAKGKSKITGIHYIERGYENIIDKLKVLGADIERKEG